MSGASNKYKIGKVVWIKPDDCKCMKGKIVGYTIKEHLPIVEIDLGKEKYYYPGTSKFVTGIRRIVMTYDRVRSYREGKFDEYFVRDGRLTLSDRSRLRSI